jgi:putative DNA primase/helicase
MQQMDNEQCGKLMKHITSSLSTSKLKAMVENAESEAGMTVEPDTFDRDPWLLNCANGTIDLRTGTLRPASREDYLTRCLSIRYNPQATCPTWQGFLDRVMGGKQGLVAFLHRAIGYSLTGSTIEQCLFILHGPTKTGKSTFLSRLLALLGTYGTTADMESFMHKDRPEIRADLADLAGARVVCAVEAQEGKRLNENLIKQLTGGVDQVKARFLFEDYFTFTPQFKVFLGTNHKPVIKDNDQAIWERIRLVPFVVQIPPGERKKDFDAELHQEIEGILAWAVQGCLDWQRLGDLKPPPEVVNATKEYQEESDIIGRFIADKCVKLTQAEARASALWNAYKDWCEHHGETWVKQTAFGRKLTEEGFGKRESHGIIYTGIGLRSEDQD